MQKTIYWKVILQPISVERCTTVSRLTVSTLTVVVLFSVRIRPLFHTTVQLASTPGTTFEGFMVEARESNSPFSEDFEEGSTIWGTWIADPNGLYHAIECNRSMNSSEGPFQVRCYP